MINVGIIVGDITKKAGTERAVTNLSNMLCKSGKYCVWLISMYSAENSRAGYELSDSVVLVHLNLNKSKRVLSYAKFVCMAGTMVSGKSIQIMIGTTHAINCLLGFVRKKVKVVACEHLSYGACPKYSRIIRQRMYPKLHAVVLLTKGDASNYTFIDSKNIYVIPNSLSFDNNTLAELHSKRILAIGRLTAQKWFQKLLEAAIEIKDKLSDWHIEIFGEGEEKEELKKMIIENALEDYVHIYPPVKNIREQYMASDMLVVTSRWEGLPMVILEAEACGLPIISFDCTYGPGELVEDGGNGYLVPVGDAHYLAEKIVELAVNDKKRKQMGRASFINSQKFKECEVFQLWDSMLNEVTGIKEE